MGKLQDLGSQCFSLAQPFGTSRLARSLCAYPDLQLRVTSRRKPSATFEASGPTRVRGFWEPEKAPFLRKDVAFLRKDVVSLRNPSPSQVSRRHLLASLLLQLPQAWQSIW